ncbi:hypothetical protein HPB50_002827 [Hyalomma asiaticum]|uniref:Uncharacterized protein n=1 Tax=Hyalomma asiaticum TaxID=266040 RepID=A0ACB7SAC9_HYAAI|nr:hypothetical protein HPB50_002827 [Hyalomma asiaticum]
MAAKRQWEFNSKMGRRPTSPVRFAYCPLAMPPPDSGWQIGVPTLRTEREGLYAVSSAAIKTKKQLGLFESRRRWSPPGEWRAQSGTPQSVASRRSQYTSSSCSSGLDLVSWSSHSSAVGGSNIGGRVELSAHSRTTRRTDDVSWPSFVVARRSLLCFVLPAFSCSLAPGLGNPLFSERGCPVLGVSSVLLEVARVHGALSSSIREDFLCFVPVDDVSASSLAHTLKRELLNLGLHLNMMRGQGYDGAAAMSGAFNGVQALILKDFPTALYTHCSSHSLNLCLSDASAVQDIRRAFEDSGPEKTSRGVYKVFPPAAPILRDKRSGVVLPEILGTDHHIVQLDIPHTRKPARTGTAKITEWKCIIDHLSSNSKSSIVGIDVQGAFDNVSHDAILSNLESLDCGSRTYNYVRSFLTDSTAAVGL